MTHFAKRWLLLSLTIGVVSVALLWPLWRTPEQTHLDIPGCASSQQPALPANQPHASDTSPDIGNVPSLEQVPEPELSSDVRLLLDLLIEQAEKRDHALARISAMKVRQVLGTDAEPALAELRKQLTAPDAGTQAVTKINVLSYLLLATPETGFAEMFGLLRQRWTLKTLSVDRTAAVARLKSLPVSIEYRAALDRIDRNLATSIGFALTAAALDNDQSRLGAILDLSLRPYVNRTEPFVDLPDPWLSELLGRCAEQRGNFGAPAVRALFSYCDSISGLTQFSERLRHQARIVGQRTPESISDLVASLGSIRSDQEAGTLIGHYLERTNMTPTDLLLTLAALRSGPLAANSTTVLAIALESCERMHQSQLLESFASMALRMQTDATLSDDDSWQLSGVVHSTSRQFRLQSLGPAESAAGGRRSLFFGAPTPDILSGIESLIAKCGGASSGWTLSRRKLVAWETAMMISELAVASEEKLELFRRLLKSIGGSTDTISSTVLRATFSTQERGDPAGFELYISSLVELFLSERGMQPEVSAPKWTSEKGRTLELAIVLKDVAGEFPDLALTAKAREVLKQLFDDVAALHAAKPSGSKEQSASKAVDLLRHSKLVE